MKRWMMLGIITAIIGGVTIYVILTGDAIDAAICGGITLGTFFFNHCHNNKGGGKRLIFCLVV